MKKFLKRAELFLSILREDNNRNEIDESLHFFNEEDWEALLEFSTKVGLFPQFFTRLSEINLENIPSKFSLKLKNLYIFNIQRNIILEKRLWNALSSFRVANILVIPLKGPVLARYIYKDSALRQVPCDLDLLIEEKNIEEAQIILRKLGYNTNKEIDEFIHKFENCEITFCKRISGSENSLIDLHWNIRHKAILADIESFFKNARKINIEGNSVLVLSYEDLILCLTIFSIFDSCFVQIKYLYDLHKLFMTHGKEINWEALINRAREYNLDTSLYFSLKLSYDLFHTNLPKEILPALRPTFIRENICKLALNKTNILKSTQKASWDYIWYYFISNYLCANNMFLAIKTCYKRIFLPMEEVMSLYNQPASKRSYILYMKRLLKPFSTKSFILK